MKLLTNQSALGIDGSEKLLRRIRWVEQQALESKLAAYVAVVVVRKDRFLDLRELPPELIAFLSKRELAPSALRVADERGQVAQFRQFLTDGLGALVNVGKCGHKTLDLLPNESGSSVKQTLLRLGWISQLRAYGRRQASRLTGGFLLRRSPRLVDVAGSGVTDSSPAKHPNPTGANF